MPRTLSIDVLRQAAERLLDRAEQEFGPEIDLDSQTIPIGFHWEIPLDQSFRMVDSPTTETGDIADDLSEINELLTRPIDETYLWHDLDHLTGLLRCIAFIALPT
jgi:hypothetical protein